MKDRQGKRIIGKTVKIFIIFLMAAAVILPQTIMCGHADEDNNELTVQMGTSADNMITLNTGGGQTYSAPLNWSKFNIDISGSYPSGATSKQLDITLAYGLTWWVGSGAGGWAEPSYNQIDQTQSWYKNIDSIIGADKVNGGGTDEQKSLHQVSGNKYGRTVGDGTLTIQFNDSLTEFKTTDLAFGTLAYNEGLGEDYLQSIDDPVKVTLSYVMNGKLYTSQRNLSQLIFTNLPEKSNPANTVSRQFTDDDGNIIIPEGGTSNSSQVFWGDYPDPVQGDYLYTYMLSDSYLLYKVPAALQYKDASHARGIASETEISFDQCDGSYTAPDGKQITFNQNQKLVLIHLNAGPGSIAGIQEHESHFVINWSFPENSFQDGDIVTVELADANIKYDSSVSYLAVPDKEPKATYIIRKREPDVFVGQQYEYKNAHDFQGTTTFDMSGAPEFNYAQESKKGTPAFGIGNRGTGDSNPKTVHFNFDKNNHGGYGVTHIYFPHTTNDANKDIKLKYRTWNGRDENTISDVKTATVHINNNGSGNTFSVSQTDGYQAGTFLKEVTYDIGAIPAQWNPYTYDYGYYTIFERNITGVTLTDQVVASKDDQGIIMQMGVYDTDGDQSDIVTDTRYVNLSGKYFLDDIIANLWSGDYPSLVAGEKKRVTYGLSSGNGAGSPEFAGRIDKIYVLSPYGDEFTNWSVNGSDGYAIQVKPQELETTGMKLPEKYKNAKLYVLDFTGITNDDLTTFLKSRMNGGFIKTSGYKPEGKPISSNGISISFDWNSSYSDSIGTTAKDLIWVKPFYPTNKNGSPDESRMNCYGSWSKNTFGIPGERDDALFNASGLVKIQSAQSLGVTVNSSSKYSNDLHTWENNDTYTEMANDGMKYQLVVGNGTNTDINHAELYIPVPKKKEQWGQKYQNNNFNYDMKLSGMPSFTKGANSEGQCTWYYTTSTSGTPEDASFTDWHELKNDTYLSGVTMLKAALTDIKKQSVQTIDVPLETTMTDLSGEPVNQWKTVYVSHMTTATTAPSSVPVTAQIKNIQLKGYVWMDANHDGKKDSDESFMKDVHLTLHNGTVSSESVTDANGGYTFNTYSTNPGQYIEITLPDGTFITQKQNDSVFDPGTHQYTFENGLNKTSYDGLNCGLINVPVVTIKKADSKSKKDIGEVGFQLKKDGNAVNVNGQTDGSFLIHDTDKNTGFTIRDLADGTYTLTETKTPFGYNALSGDVTFTVKNGVVSAGHDERISLSDDYKVLTVYNDPGIRLPDTGGKGTLIFRITGVGLIIAAVLLIVEKRNGRR